MRVGWEWGLKKGCIVMFFISFGRFELSFGVLYDKVDV